MQARFEGKVGVVTGGASGIGEGIVRRLVGEGCRCVIADLQEERGRALAQELGDHAHFRRVDVSSEEDVAAMVAYAVDELGGLDCLFNNAGVLGVVGSLIDTPRADWDRSLAVLLTSVFLGIKHGARVMRDQGFGAIVNTASTAGIRGGLGPHAYTAAKHAVVGLTESAAVELAPAGVRVNAIAPGATVSAMTAGVVAGDPTALDKVEERLTKRFGRAAMPQDVAAAAVFLASDEAWYVNGTCLVIDAASEGPGGEGPPIFRVCPGLFALTQAVHARKQSVCTTPDWKEVLDVLLGMDEYPYHQITATFAGVAGTDPAWNDGHYICLSDMAGEVALTSTLRMYQNNDVLDGFVCIRHAGRQHNIRVSRRLRPYMEPLTVGPLRLEILEPLKAVRLVLEDNEHGISLDVICRSSTLPYEGPPEFTRVDGRLMSERITYEVTGKCEGWVRVGDDRIELNPTTDSFFRNHSWGYQAGRGGPRLYAAPVVGAKRRVPGVRQWVLFDMPDHGGFYFVDPSGRAASGKGAIMLGDRSIPVVDVASDLQFYEGGRRLRSGTFRLTDAEGVDREYLIEDLGWVYCQGGGYFGGFDDGLGQGVYRGDLHIEGEVWDVAHPTEIVDKGGNSFEFDHAWAENFTRLTCKGQQGLAHFECVVIQDAQAWTTHPGKAAN